MMESVLVCVIFLSLSGESVPSFYSFIYLIINVWTLHCSHIKHQAEELFVILNQFKGFNAENPSN